jgi:hypothetical protein
MNYIVTGNPRCGTSMMMRCLEKAGIRMAFKDVKKNEKEKKQFRNIYGFYEGRWDGGSGAIKFENLNRFNNPRVIVMIRDLNGIINSWREIRQKNNLFDNKILEKRKKLIVEKREKLLIEVRRYDHIIVNYDEFVTSSEKYRESFQRWGLNYDLLVTGIDKELYIDRR